MNDLDQQTVDQALDQAIAGLDIAELKTRFEAQNGLIVLDDFLPASLLEAFVGGLDAVRGEIHRNYVPAQKKGGSVSRHSLDRVAPAYGALYRSKTLRALLEALTGETLFDCREADPHTYALYCYTEPGDHIGWHYDTSFYRGKRFTLLFGLIENQSCKLECELYKDDPSRETEPIEVTIHPGTMVLFDGDRLWHRVTPLAEGDRERIILTTEYVTDPSMTPWRHLISNVKDAAAYFGWKEVFLGVGRRRGGRAAGAASGGLG